MTTFVFDLVNEGKFNLRAALVPADGSGEDTIHGGDGLDIITKNIGVPSDLKVGDWLCIGGMGAYTYGCRSNFNGMKTTEKIINLPMDVEKEHSGKRIINEVLA